MWNGTNQSEVAADRNPAYGNWLAELGVGAWELHYQPQLDLLTGELVGVEALLRCFDRSDHRQVPTQGLVAEAERIGIIGEVGRAVLGRACAEFMDWIGPDAGPTPRLSVNVSPQQLVDDRLVTHVGEALGAANMPPGRLVIELTEGPMPDADRAAASIGEVRELGVRLALDDFGVAASSLGRLQAIEPDQIKLDRRFLATLTSSRLDRAIVCGVADLAALLDVDLIVEGVETIDQVRILTESGVRIGQGFFFSRPVPIDRVDAARHPSPRSAA